MLPVVGPNGERTLLDVLLAAAEAAPDQVIVHVRADGDERTVRFRELRDESLKVAGGYLTAGVAPGTPVILLADAGDDFQPMFWGALAAGLVPVPLPPEPARVRAVLDLLADSDSGDIGSVVVTDEATAGVLDHVPGCHTLRLTELRAGRPPRQLPAPAPDDVAFLQFSSGSTGVPRGVELTHANVLANLEQARAASAATAEDVLVTWMPYFHDMGLIGTHLTPLAVRLKQVRIPPLAFAKRPALWFETAARHRATLLSAANFALTLTVRRVPEATLAALDLSPVRFIGVGAEPISATVWRAFLARTRAAGLDPRALQPVYGLAEATLAVTFPPLGELAVPIPLERAALGRGLAVDAETGEDAVELMDLGRPVAGCEIRVVDDRRRPLADRQIGQIEVRGPNVARSYHRSTDATRATFVDGWLRTGDLGFLRDGRLCVTGREKDVVFVNGRKYHAPDLEEVVAGTPGLPPGLAAVVGSTDPARGVERVVVFVQWARPPVGSAGPVLDRVQARVAETLGHDDVRVLPIPARTFPRTTSGKLRRGRLRERYEAGDFADLEQRWQPDRTDRRTRLNHPTVPWTVSRSATRPQVEEIIRNIWARVLDRPGSGIDRQDTFFAIGGSSLKAMEVLAALDDAFGLTLEPAVLRDCATVAALTDHIVGRMAGDGPARATRTGPPADPSADQTADPPPGQTTNPLADPTTDPLAVIGVACRFPGADTPEAFWQQLLAGRDSVGEVPADRWSPSAATGRWGSFLDDPTRFDADFFGMTDEEARFTDPHARIFLELAYEALERAGYAGPRRRGRRVGVFAAVGESGYPELLHRLAKAGEPLPAAALIGNLRNLIPARVAQALDLTGPALAVDTACSSALVALHLAHRSLAAGECDIAIVGGVNLNLTPTAYRLLAAAQALSPTGRCHAFDAAADGFVPGEGGAALVLSRLTDARDAGDHVQALVRGTAVNNDGRSLSLMAPNPLRQQEVIAKAYRDAGVDPDLVSYVEAHGTGTELGDPVEVRSLAYAFPPRADGEPRWVGSVKTNLGHLLNSAAMPSLVKVVLALQRRQLPPSLHHRSPSPRFDLAGAGFAVVTEARTWTATGPLVAGVNAFGFGGTNAHAILQQAPTADEPPADEPPAEGGGADQQRHLLTLSARSAPALRAAAGALAEHLRAHPDLDEGDVCASASTARDDGPYRLAIVAGGDLADRLCAAAEELPASPEAAAGSVAAGSPAPSTCPPTARTLLAAGEYWQRGGKLDRSGLDAGSRRVPLPTYPFQRRRYHLPELSPAAPGDPTPPDAARLVHRVVWDDAPPGPGETPRTVRLVRPGTESVAGKRFADALATGLADRGVAVNAAPTPDGAPPVAGAPPADVTVFLAGPAPDPPDVAALDAAVEATVRGFQSNLDRLGTGPHRLLLVTEDVQATGAAPERLRPVQSILTGLAAALPDERPGLVVRTVDLSSLDGEDVRLAALARELAAFPAGPTRPEHDLPHSADRQAVGLKTVDPKAVDAQAVVAWRGRRRLTRTVVAGLPPEAAQTAAQTAARVGLGTVADGVHLIIGGTGGVGAALARDLARCGSPTLVLAGRSASAPEALLAELRALGATVDYRRCDVTLASDVDALLAGLPRVDAIFHAAGIVRPGTLRSKSTAEVTGVLAPKVRGSYLLVDAVRRHGHDPAVLVAFSSVSSVLPGLAGAIADYAAANAFLDAFAAAERAAGRPLRALGFAAFAGTGMAAAPGASRALAAQGMTPLATHDALRALRAALSVDASHLLIGDLQPTPYGPTNSRPPGGYSSASSTAVTVPDLDGVTHDDLVVLLRRLLAEPLQRQPADIATDTPFLSLGLDSLSAVDLVKRLEEELGRQLPVTLFFEYTTVAELAAHLSAPPAARATSATPAGPAPADEGPGRPFPLTPVQLAFHTNERLHPGTAAYGFVRQTVSGPLDAHLLGLALAHLEARHPMLRMRIVTGGTTPRQAITPPPDTGTATPIWYDVQQLSGPVAALAEELCNRPIDLTRDSPMRAVLAREGPERCHLILVLHHAAGDGFSLNVLGEELWSVYSALLAGRLPRLSPLTADFRDHVLAAGPPVETDLAFWRHLLAGEPGPLPLPFDGDPDEAPAPPYAAYQVALDGSLASALRDRAASCGVSLFHLLLAGYARCLARWSGQRRVAINVARAGRESRLPGIERLVGPFADTLPVFVDVDPDEPAGKLADRLRLAWLASEQHGSVSSLDLARLLTRPGGGPRTVSPASFSFARFPSPGSVRAAVTVSATVAGTASAATRLGLLCWESDATLRLSWNFPVRLFDRATVARLAADHLTELIGLAGTGRPRPGREVDPTPPAPGTAGDVTARIRAICRAVPDEVAVETGGNQLTYRELDQAADRVAALLQARGVGRGGRVGLLTEAGPAAVAGVVGILRSGAAWVPLDATHPTPRLADQLARSGARIVLYHDPTRGAADALGGSSTPVHIGSLVHIGSSIHIGSPLTRPADTVAPPDPDDLAYVIFTSGSTGRPKGVPVTHRSMCNYLDWAIATFGYAAGDRLTQTAPICFDASVRQLLAPLLVGATVVTLPPMLVRDPEALLSVVERDRISVWSSVPTLWARLLRAAEDRLARTGTPPDLRALRWIHVGGEVLSPSHVRRWFDLFGTGHRITNLYGPTEATINATWHLIDRRPADGVRRLPIGRPIGGAVVEVVGPDGGTCPTGQAGELYLGGIGLTTGYLDDPQLTAAAFVERGGLRFYRSGDRGRVGPTGEVEFLGRLDDQVKIHGYRVEPGEIESVLQTHPAVELATVLHRGDPHPRLDAFVRPARDAAPSVAELRAFLAASLPEYMVPARFQLLDAMPLTSTGKVDREKLSTLGASTDRGDAPPAATETATERRLARIWRDLLGVGVIGREDDFFALGGDSILVLEVFERLRNEVPVVPRPTVFYRHRTLAALAGAIDAAVPEAQAYPASGPATSGPATSAPLTIGDLGSGPAVPVGAGPFPLTPTQRGFLLAEAIAPGASSSWLARLRLRGPLRLERFQRAVDVLVARHQMLRVVFPAGARPPVQQELPASLRLPVEYEVLDSPSSVADRVATERRRRLEPWAWPLLRLRLLSVAPDDHVLLVHAHHLIGDGYSAALLGHELLLVYGRLDRAEPAELTPLRADFRDYVALLRRRLDRAPDTAARSWWRERFADPYEPPLLRVCDADTGPRDGALTAGFTLDDSVGAGLRRIAADAGASAYAPVLTAFHRALAHLTGRDDLVLGLAVTGRDHPLPDVNRLFGPCAMMVPLRLSGTGAFRDHLRYVTGEVAAAREHGDHAPPEQEWPGPSPTGSRARVGAPPGAQFPFSYLDFDALRYLDFDPPGPSPGGLLSLRWDEGDAELEPPPVGTDVFLTARPVDGGLRITLRASPAALTPGTLAGLADRLRDDLTTAGTLDTGFDTGAAAASAGDHTTADDGAGGTRGGSSRTRSGGSGSAGRRDPSTSLDAGIVGYLPAPHRLATIAGLPPDALPREQLRALLFPGGAPRLLEELTTPLGTSGFLCLPRFADELATAGESLAAQVADAVGLAADLGARCVSLAGMIPAHTGYGFEVLRRTRGDTPVTTGHAATAVSVVMTTLAALTATGRTPQDRVVAVVGLGSIGRSSLELLLDRSPRQPARLILCDVAGSGARLAAFAARLADSGYPGEVELCESTPYAPAAVYRADLIVGATSAATETLDVYRLRPGTVVVDDSFPHFVDPVRAIARMRRERDVLVVGGGLLNCGVTRRVVPADLPPAAIAGHAARLGLPGAVASCQLESLLRAATATLPLVHGLVDGAAARTYWDAVSAAGIDAAPLHLLDHRIDPTLPAALPR